MRLLLGHLRLQEQQHKLSLKDVIMAARTQKVVFADLSNRLKTQGLCYGTREVKSATSCVWGFV